jgi:tripartite-type tricarboxylate transporter receptor subunit TctC
MIKDRAGIGMGHVPYKSGNAVLRAVFGREIDMMMTTPSALPHVTAGRLKSFAVTRAKRWHEISNTPTTTESGYANSWRCSALYLHEHHFPNAYAKIAA